MDGRKRRKMGWVLLVLAIVYVSGVILFQNRFGFRTYVDGESVFFRTAAEVAAERTGNTARRRLSFVRRNGFGEDVSLGSLGVYRPSERYFREEPGNSWLWFLQLFHRTDYGLDPGYSYDEDTLLQNLRCLDCVRTPYVVPAVPARVVASGDGYRVLPESSGTRIDPDRLYQATCEALGKGILTVDLEDTGCYVLEEIPDRTGTCFPFPGTADAFSVNLGCGLTVSVPEEVLREAASGGTLRYDVMAAYVRMLKSLYDTVGRDRTFAATGGDLVEIPYDSWNNYLGWNLNVNGTTARICEAMLSGEREAPAVWYSRGGVHPEGSGSDLGETYVEISLKEQHLWFYEDGDLYLDTDVVTGLAGTDRETPAGLYRILDFNPEYTMYGDYGTAFAHYFLRITDSGIGIHDAPWRDAYGGDAYLTDGSHGCVNVPCGAMERLFERLRSEYLFGVPVVIY